jgi:DNA-binding CsgD family transcriptional regulator/tetratricopeptide (TPR) repeat protein
MLERLGCYLWEAGKPVRSAAAYTEAEQLLGAEVTGVHATVWGAMARAALINAEFDEAIPLAERAADAARAHGALAVLADALITRGAAQAIRSGDAAGLEFLREGVQLARDVEDRGVLCRGYANLIVALEFAGRPAEACEVALEGLRLLPEYGLELSVGAALACNAANMLVRRGQYARSEEVLDELLDGRLVRGQALHLYLERAELQLRTGRTAEARASLEAAAELRNTDEPAVVAALAAATAELLAQEGDLEGCYRTVDEALRRLAGTQDRIFRAELLLIALRAEADAVPIAGRTDPGAEARLRRLSDELDRVTPTSDEDRNLSAFSRASHNELLRLRGAVTAEDWAGSADLWRSLERPREQAYALLRQAECFAGDKQRDKAAATATQAREIAERLGAAPLVAEVDALLARTRLSVAPAPRAPVEDRPYGLTDREHEVLVLLGTGATNRQIARRLFISERTVGVHVSRVLHKLQVTNRAQAAAVAVKIAR